ncbi:MAG: alpha/beta fold hydrolase [Myxococcota bacterium]
MKTLDAGMLTTLVVLLGCPSEATNEPGSDAGALSSRDDDDDGDDDDDDDDDDDGDDEELLAWPQPYQDFIAEVGGSKFVDVGGAAMHYVETGSDDGPTVLLVHGIPTHAYLWRDVIPQLDDYRVIAVDLIGYGRSDRPAGLPYTPGMQVDFLQSFVEDKGLDDVHLVVHDLGGPVGLRWAFENSDRVASITMFETLWTTLPGIEVIPAPFGELLAGLRTPGVGEQLVGEQNVFLSMLGAFTVEGVAPEDAAVYQHPWPDAADRIEVILPSGPHAFPFPEDPEAFAFVDEYQQFLSSSPIPKLVIDVEPGTLSAVEIPGPGGGADLRVSEFAEQVFPNTTRVQLSGGGHFVQEDRPVQLGQVIDAFLDDLDED